MLTRVELIFNQYQANNGLEDGQMIMIADNVIGWLHMTYLLVNKGKLSNEIENKKA